MKPIIGVMPLWDDEKKSLWMLPGYLDGIAKEGGIPVIFPFSDKDDDLKQLMSMCDGFLFTGGHDVQPSLYGEEPIGELLERKLLDCCEKRDRMELIVLREAMKEQKPILGICRGLQFINAALGGSLYQDLPLQHPSDVVHHQPAPYNVPSHEVKLTEGSPLYTCLADGVMGQGSAQEALRAGSAQSVQASGQAGLQNCRLAVNSCHHQAIKDLAPGLKPMAVSDDGLVEAFYLPDYPFLWAVQWHPEFCAYTDENSQKIFRAFVNSMK